MNRVLQRNKLFELVEVKRRGPGNGGIRRPCYEIKNLSYPHLRDSLTKEQKEQARDICDPDRNKSGALGCKWRYRSRDSAERCFLMLTLLFGA
jgi:hypothetical protein